MVEPSDELKISKDRSECDGCDTQCACNATHDLSPPDTNLTTGPEISNDADRRNFLKQATTITLGALSLTVLPWSRDNDDGKNVGGGSATPIVYGFLVDTEKCIGAGKCLTACRVENDVPEGYSRTWVERYIHYKDGRVEVDRVPESGYHAAGLVDIDSELIDRSYFVPKLCNHCEDAPCNQVCPVHASFTSPEGVELIDTDSCIGCAYCVQACPYGVRFVNPNTNSADKCTWCYHRITQNEKPACVEACPVDARVFGSLDDPASELNRRLAKVPHHVLREHLGTHPKLHYIGLSGEVN